MNAYEWYVAAVGAVVLARVLLVLAFAESAALARERATGVRRRTVPFIWE